MEGLNTAQRNFLWASLHTFEVTLRQTERWLRERTERGYLYRSQLRLSPEREAEVRQLLQTALRELATASEQLGLAPREESINRLLSGQFSVCWAELVDAHPARLQGYGEVSAQVVAEAGAALERMAAYALRLSRLLGEGETAPLAASSSADALGDNGGGHA